jgi:L-lactate utilization protein LutC
MNRAAHTSNLYGNLLGSFSKYAQAAEAQVHTARSQDAASIAASIAASPRGESSEGTARICCASALRREYPAIYERLHTDFGVAVAEEIAAEVIEAAEQTAGREALASALTGVVGIVMPVAGVAETGSVVLADDSLSLRLLSMLAEVSVAILPVSAILPSLDEAAELLERLGEEGHRYISLVTGPSRTADIERVLTIGVQGPKAFHIIVLLDEGASGTES